MSRRTVVKGAAWSVPVIAAAAAVPMSVASTGSSFCQQADSSWFGNSVLTTWPLDTPTLTEAAPGTTTGYLYDQVAFPVIRVGMRLTFTYLGTVPLDLNNFAIGSFGKREPDMPVMYGDWKVTQGSLNVIAPSGYTAVGFTSSDPLVPSYNLSGAFRLGGLVSQGMTVTIEWESTKSITDQPDLTSLAGDRPSAEGYLCTTNSVLSPNETPTVSYQWMSI